jgi:hypothetical protein
MNADLFPGVGEGHTLELGSRTKIEMKTDLDVGCLQGVQQLRFVCGFDRSRRLQFYDHRFLDQEVSTKFPHRSASKPD